MVKSIQWNRRDTTEYESPDVISDFFSVFAQQVKPKNILDPFCWIGKSIRNVIDWLWWWINVSCIDVNPDTIQKAKELSKEYEISFVQWNFFDDHLKLKSNYDLILADLPRGMPVSWEFRKSHLEWPNKFCDLLNDWWYAVFTAPYIFFRHKFEDLLSAIKDKWCNIVWVIKVPDNTYYPRTSADSNIIIIQKAVEVKDVFIATLDNIAPKNIVKNFFDKEYSKDISPRWFVLSPEDSDFRWYFYWKYVFVKYIERYASKYWLKIIPKDSYVINSRIDFSSKNSVYVKRLSSSSHNVFTSLNEIPVTARSMEREKSDRYRNYFQIVFDDDIDISVFAMLYNSNFWKKFFSMFWWTYTQALYPREVSESDLYFPYDQKDHIKSNYMKYVKIKGMYEDLSIQMEEDPFADDTDEILSLVKLQSWTQAIMSEAPSPIAKLYDKYESLRGKDKARDLYNIIDRLFYTIIIFNWSVLLSALKTEKTIYQDYVSIIRDSVNDITKSNLWDWINLSSTLAKEFRKLNSNPETEWVVQWLFSISNPDFLKWITNKEIYNVIDRYRSQLRNEEGHFSPADDWYKSKIKLAEEYLEELLSHCRYLKDISLFRTTGNCSRPNRDEYLAEIVEYKWIWNWKIKKILLDIHPLNDTNYILVKWSSHPIELFEYIKFDTSDSEENYISYFYNKIQDWKAVYLAYELWLRTREKSYKLDDLNWDIIELFMSDTE